MEPATIAASCALVTPLAAFRAAAPSFGEADSLLRVIQVPVKPVLAIAVAVQIVIAFFRIEAENVSVFLRIGSESQLSAVETWFLAVRVPIAVRSEHCSVSKNCLVLGL